MATRIEIEHEGRRYFWTEKQGIIGADFMVPPKNLLATLETKLAPLIEDHDAQVTDFRAVLDMAIAAKLNDALPRAQRLAERAVQIDPNHEGAISVLSSILRRRNRPEKALELTEPFKKTRNTALLTTRAAAMADLGREDEALVLAGRAWAISCKRGKPDEELQALYRRLKPNG